MRTGPVCFSSVSAREPKNLQQWIGQRFAEKRIERQMTQERVAVAMGVQRSQVANIERGRTDMSLQRFLLACDALECTADELLEGYW